MKLNRFHRMVLDRFRTWQSRAIGGRLTVATVDRWPKVFPPATVGALKHKRAIRISGDRWEILG